MNKFFMRISLTLIIYKNRRAAYLSARARCQQKLKLTLFLQSAGLIFVHQVVEFEGLVDVP